VPPTDHPSPPAPGPAGPGDPSATPDDAAPDDAEREREVAARTARQRIAAGALVRDPAGRILMVEPSYKPTWEIPGGMVEAQESPLDACHREIREELGIDVPITRLLVVDWVPRRGVWPEGLLFVFDGGTMSPDRLAEVTLPDDELLAVRFVTLAQARDHVGPGMHLRLREALTAALSPHGAPVYLEQGRHRLAPA